MSTRPGQTLLFHLYWQAEAATATDYQVFNHLLDAEGNLVAQIDGPPLPIHCCAAVRAIDPEEIIYSRNALALPEDLPSRRIYYRHRLLPARQRAALLTPTGEDSLLSPR